MTTLIKLGGSLITDKTQAETFRDSVMTRVAKEIHSALDWQPEMRLVIGHGSGSFGHVEAKKHDTINGVYTTEQWRGFARVAAVAAALNHLVSESFIAADVPIFRIQPSASLISNDGKVTRLALDPLRQALDHGLVPLVYGDVSVDTVRGGTIISTESLFKHLMTELVVDRILLCGEVDGVLDSEANIIPEINSKNFEIIRDNLGRSRGDDVTGGMLAKVEDMLTIARHASQPRIYIINGLVPDRIRLALLGENVEGTCISDS